MGKIQAGQAQGYGRPGDRIWVRVGDKDVSARAASEINSTQVLVTTDGEGRVRALTDTSPELMRSETTTFVKQEPKIQTPDPASSLLKVLFSVIQGDNEIFYVGGDREEPVEVCVLPYREPINAISTGGRAYGALQPTGSGLDDFLVSVNYSDPNATEDCHRRAIVTRSPAAALKNTHNWQIDNLPEFLEFLGDGIWSIPVQSAMSGSLLETEKGSAAFLASWQKYNFQPAEPTYSATRWAIPSAIVYGSPDSEQGQIEWFDAWRSVIPTEGGALHEYYFPQKLAPDIFKVTGQSNSGLFLTTSSWQTLLITPGQTQIFYYQERVYDSIQRVVKGKEFRLPLPANLGSVFAGSVFFYGGAITEDTYITEDSLYRVSYNRTGFEPLVTWSKNFYTLIRATDPKKKWAGISIYKIEASGATPLVKTVTPEALAIPQAEQGDETFAIHAIAYLPSSD